jgi:peroxiredoxin
MYTLIDPQLHEEKVTLPQLYARSTYTLLYFYPKDDTP